MNPEKRERLRERIEVYGVAATLIAEAYLVLPGDERVPVPLSIGRDAYGTPILEPDWKPVTDAIHEREAASP